MKTELAKTLENLGMVDAFLEGRAEFSKMFDASVYISRVMQRSHIEAGSHAIHSQGTSTFRWMSRALLEQQLRWS